MLAFCAYVDLSEPTSTRCQFNTWNQLQTFYLRDFTLSNKGSPQKQLPKWQMLIFVKLLKAETLHFDHILCQIYCDGVCGGKMRQTVIVQMLLYPRSMNVGGKEAVCVLSYGRSNNYLIVVYASSHQAFSCLIQICPE